VKASSSRSVDPSPELTDRQRAVAASKKTAEPKGNGSRVAATSTVNQTSVAVGKSNGGVKVSRTADFNTGSSSSTSSTNHLKLKLKIDDSFKDRMRANKRSGGPAAVRSQPLSAASVPGNGRRSPATPESACSFYSSSLDSCLSTLTPKEETPDVDIKCDPLGDLFCRTPTTIGTYNVMDDLADLDCLPASELFMSQWPSSTFGLDIYQLIDAELMSDFSPLTSSSSLNATSTSGSSRVPPSTNADLFQTVVNAPMTSSSSQSSSCSSSTVEQVGEYDTPEVSEMLGCDDWIKSELDSDFCFA